MFDSLASRIAAVGILVVLALLVVGAALVDASRQSRESFQWVTHSSKVLQALDESIAGIRDAESGMRGYILTRNPNYAQSFEVSVDKSLSAFGQLVELTKDNPDQADRLRSFGLLLDERCELARQHLKLARENRFEEARLSISGGRGLELMGALSLAANQLEAEERHIQKERIRAMNARMAWAQRLSVIGLPLVALFVTLMSYILIRNVRHPVVILNRAMDGLGEGELSTRINQTMGSTEFDRVAIGYNAMADRLEVTSKQRIEHERELKTLHAELLSSTQILKQRGEVIEILGGMAHRMQAARTVEEMSSVVKAFVPRVLPNMPGVLFAHNNSRNLLVPFAEWGDCDHAAEPFAPDQCWALRRGQSHFVSKLGADVRCNHVDADGPTYHCEPLLASGEVIGVLYLQGVVDKEYQFRLKILVQDIASAMVNQQLQRDLKEQTIRDSLTGLFNRRYMEEALALEVARSGRSGQPLSVVMCDVDHFKRFNDDYGHDAGDLVLQAVSNELANRFRDGDIVCRYGGEEFTIIAPGTTPEALHKRLEMVRAAVSNLKLKKDGQVLGNLTMSFGVAQWHTGKDGDRIGQRVLKSADAALYRAKNEGRNRVVIDERSIED